jgi:hypothetical protein
LGRTLQINGGHAAFQAEETVRKTYGISVSGTRLPLELHVDNIFECSIIETEIPLDEARSTAAAKAMEQAAAGAPPGAEPGKILVRFGTSADGKSLVTVTLEYIEEIGAEQLIGGE